MLKLYIALSVIITLSTVEVLADESGFNLFKFQQYTNKISAERYELVSYNKKFYEYASITTFKHNRTCAALNLTFLTTFQLGNEIQVVVQTYKFLSNEYRVFPIRFQISLCDAIKENAAGVGNAKNCGNFRGCPINKGVPYVICNWTIDESKFPPLIPEGRYMVEIQEIFHGTELMVVRAYIAITHPMSMSRK